VCIRFCLLIMIGSFILAGCGKGESTDGLIGNLESGDGIDRVKAVRQLQHRKEDAPKIVPALIELLKDKDVKIRLDAVIGLGQFGAEAESALPELEKAKSDKDRRIRDAAKRAISRISGKEDDDETAPNS
jgi:HEAT repeat protein